MWNIRTFHIPDVNLRVVGINGCDVVSRSPRVIFSPTRPLSICLIKVSCEQAVIMDGTGRSCGVTKDKGGHTEKGRTWEVGLKPAGVYDIYDMVGNAEEWVADWYSKDFTECGEACLGTDPKGPCGGAADCAGHDKKMVMGGSWYWPAEHAHGWHRRPHFPANKPYHHFGFRCAAAVEQADAMGAAPVEAHPPAE